MFIWFPGYQGIEGNEKADGSSVAELSLNEIMACYDVYTNSVINDWAPKVHKRDM